MVLAAKEAAQVGDACRNMAQLYARHDSLLARLGSVVVVAVVVAKTCPRRLALPRQERD